jgi:hypothetical protein
MTDISVENSRIERLACDLDDLRRRYRSMRRGWIFALVIVAGCSAAGFALQQTREVTADKFVLVDAQGRTRGLLRMTDDGTPMLSFYTSAGNVRASIAGGETGADVSVFDAKGQKAARLRSESDGHAGLAFYDGAGNEVVQLGMR